MSEFLSIGSIERDTGIARDTLRIWERRYGFPKPGRNPKGERIYTRAQLRRLQRIRRLLDQGLRPGVLLTLDDAALDRLEAQLQTNVESEQTSSVDSLLQAVLSANHVALDQQLHCQLEHHGLHDLITQVLVPLLRQVGHLWASGKLQVYHEHFVTERITTFLHACLRSVQMPCTTQTILLATLPGEAHSLGLLMLETLLSLRHIRCINLGAHVPMGQLTSALDQFKAERLALSFSAAYPYKHIRLHLLELRRLLPANVTIWCGGEGAHRLRSLPAGVVRFKDLNSLGNIGQE